MQSSVGLYYYLLAASSGGIGKSGKLREEGRVPKANYWRVWDVWREERMGADPINLVLSEPGQQH